VGQGQTGDLLARAELSALPPEEFTAKRRACARSLWATRGRLAPVVAAPSRHAAKDLAEVAARYTRFSLQLDTPCGARFHEALDNACLLDPDDETVTVNELESGHRTRPRAQTRDRLPETEASSALMAVLIVKDSPHLSSPGNIFSQLLWAGRAWSLRGRGQSRDPGRAEEYSRALAGESSACAKKTHPAGLHRAGQ